MQCVLSIEGIVTVFDQIREERGGQEKRGHGIEGQDRRECHLFHNDASNEDARHRVQ